MAVGILSLLLKALLTLVFQNTCILSEERIRKTCLQIADYFPWWIVDGEEQPLCEDAMDVLVPGSGMAAAHGEQHCMIKLTRCFSFKGTWHLLEKIQTHSLSALREYAAVRPFVNSLCEFLL